MGEEGDGNDVCGGSEPARLLQIGGRGAGREVLLSKQQTSNERMQSSCIRLRLQRLHCSTSSSYITRWRLTYRKRFCLGNYNGDFDDGDDICVFFVTYQLEMSIRRLFAGSFSASTSYSSQHKAPSLANFFLGPAQMSTWLARRNKLKGPAEPSFTLKGLAAAWLKAEFISCKWPPDLQDFVESFSFFLNRHCNVFYFFLTFLIIFKGLETLKVTFKGQRSLAAPRPASASLLACYSPKP